MKITILSLFPEMYEGFLKTSIIKKALDKQAVEIEVVNFRDYTLDRHNHVDDTPYGGGKGMLMMAPPVYDCYTAVKAQVEAELGNDIKSRVIYMSPQGKVLTQKKAEELAEGRVHRDEDEFLTVEYAHLCICNI